MKRKMLMLFSIAGVLIMLCPNIAYAQPEQQSAFWSSESLNGCHGVWSYAMIAKVNAGDVSRYWTGLGTLYDSAQYLAEVGLIIYNWVFGIWAIEIFGVARMDGWYRYKGVTLAQGYEGDWIGIKVVKDPESDDWYWYYKLSDEQPWVKFWTVNMNIASWQIIMGPYGRPIFTQARGPNGETDWSFIGNRIGASLEEVGNFPTNPDYTPIADQTYVHNKHATDGYWHEWNHISVEDGGIDDVLAIQEYNHCYWRYLAD